MLVASRIATALGGMALAGLLTACVASGPTPDDTPTGQPQGPLPPSATEITLQRLASVVSAADAPPQALFTVGAASTAGEDLVSEQEYWVSVGGTPVECADVVSSPYLVSSEDAFDAARIDDPTGALGIFTEEEDRFGLVQVYGRVFDSEATASGFLDAFLTIVAECGAYRFVGPTGDVTYAATGLRVDESLPTPTDARVLRYGEDVSGSDVLAVGTTLIQHRNAVVGVYFELYPSSTMTSADVTELVATLTNRIATL